MFMEALVGFEHKIQYSMVGHSGDGPCIELVDYGAPPLNSKVCAYLRGALPGYFLGVACEKDLLNLLLSRTGSVQGAAENVCTRAILL